MVSIAEIGEYKILREIQSSGTCSQYHATLGSEDW